MVAPAMFAPLYDTVNPDVGWVIDVAESRVAPEESESVRSTVSWFPLWSTYPPGPTIVWPSASNAFTVSDTLEADPTRTLVGFKATASDLVTPLKVSATVFA